MSIFIRNRSSEHGSAKRRTNAQFLVPLLVCFFFCLTCAKEPSLSDGLTCTLTYLDTTTFDYGVLRFVSKAGEKYIVLTKKDTSGTCLKGDKILHPLVEGQFYRLRIATLDSVPHMRVCLRGIAGDLKYYYVRHGAFDPPSDSGILLWSDGNVVTRVYGSQDICGFCVTSND